MKSNKHPLVTITMPVYNAAKFLDQAITSILDQSFTNFEFIIVNDASTDNSWQIIKKYAKKDKRIIIYQNPKNLGMSATVNFAISQAKGKYLAHMDADDISFSDRLEKQVKFLNENPDVVTLGGQCIIVDENNNIVGNKNFPTDSNKLAKMIFWAIPIQQPSMMVNLSKLPKDFYWFNPKYRTAVEVSAMFRFMNYGKLANLPDNIIFYRHLSNSLSHKNAKKTFWLTIINRLRAVKTGYYPTVESVLINIAQIFVVLLLPSKWINELWNYIRGIKKITFVANNTLLQQLKSYSKLNQSTISN